MKFNAWNLNRPWRGEQIILNISGIFRKRKLFGFFECRRNKFSLKDAENRDVSRVILEKSMVDGSQNFLRPFFLSVSI